jgi:hypothetical protein
VIELYEDAESGALVLLRASDRLAITRLTISGSSFAADAIALDSGQTLGWTTAEADPAALAKMRLIARWDNGAMEILGEASPVAARYLSADQDVDE